MKAELPSAFAGWSPRLWSESAARLLHPFEAIEIATLDLRQLLNSPAKAMPKPAKPKHYPPFDASASRPVQPSLAARLPREVVANIMRLRVEGKTKYKAQWRRLTMASVCFQWWISADIGRAVACNGDEEVDAFRVSMYKRKLKSRTKELWIYCQRQALRHGRGKRVADLLLASKALEDVELDGWPLAGEKVRVTLSVFVISLRPSSERCRSFVSSASSSSSRTENT